VSKKNSTISLETFSQKLAKRLADSPKYRALNLPMETLSNLIERAALVSNSPKEVEDIVRRKLHNLVAPYLGDPDYPALQTVLSSLPQNPDAPILQGFCRQVLQSHSSTRERLPLLEDFYPQLFARTGTPAILLDLACGLNPFSLPWMRLPVGTRYYAYDLHQPRIDFINAFFLHLGQNGEAIHQDIFLSPPEKVADVALFFKEAHRFEQRERGSVRLFLQRLNARHILLSLPTATLTGRRSMLEQDRKLVESACAGQPWSVEEILFASEIVFWIRTQP